MLSIVRTNILRKRNKTSLLRTPPYSGQIFKVPIDDFPLKNLYIAHSTRKIKIKGLTPEAVVVQNGPDDDDEYELDTEPDPPITTGKALNTFDQLQYQQNETKQDLLN